MSTPLPTRRLVGSVPCALLAALLVFVRLLAPAMAMPSVASASVELDRLARESICHAGPGDSDGPAGETPAGHADCLQCPACHLGSAAAISVPGEPVVPRPATVVIRSAAPPPPATGPPGRVRGAAQPTGPPTLSV